MNQRVFVDRRSSAWQRLETLLVHARRGIRSMSAEDVNELGRLYRAITSDLAYAQGQAYDAAILAYLNRLTARAHAQIYRNTATGGWGRIGGFFAQGFPREFRRSFGWIALCCALTIACAVVSYVLVRSHPGDAYALLPSSMVPDQIRKSLHDSNFGFDRGYSPEMSAFIITNNVRVAILAFAGCITLGVVTLYLIVFNGLMLGALGALYSNAGFGSDFWATVAPHGVIELTAIQIAGAAGLLIVAGLLAPGRLRRRDAIALNARRAGTLILGVASMLVVAGTIEGFISPQRWAITTRESIGAITALGLILYFGFAGRSANGNPRATLDPSPADTRR
jgi:uncharacterized membrane protein SpoIIM required for sporulation